MGIRCCRLRTCVLMLGFVLGFADIALWILFYTFRLEFRAYIKYSLPQEEDLIGLSVVVILDLICNILLISGANKDYSGQHRDLRRWGLMIPWMVMYALNILGLLGASILAFFIMKDFKKLVGLPPLAMGLVLLIGHILVIVFVVKQRSIRVCSGSSSDFVPESSGAVSSS